MSDDDGGWEVVTKDSKRKNKKQKDVVEDDNNDDTTTTTTTTATATSTTTSNDSKTLVDSKETAAPAAAGGATNSDATTTTPAADAPPVELKIELSSSFQAKILLAMSTIERGETNVDRRLKNHVLHLQEDANAAAPVAYQSLLGWGSNLPARVVDLLQAMDEQVPVDDQIAALAFVRLFEFVREHYYSIEKTQRKPLNDLLPELNRQLPNYNIAKYKNQLRNFIIEKLKKMNRGRLTKRYKDHINKCENVDEVRAWIFQQKGGREIWHGAETEMTGIRELGQLLHVIKSTDWKSRAPNRKSMQDIVSSVKRLVISCPRLLDLADHCIKSNGFIVVRVAKPLTEAQFRDKSTHKPAVYDHKFTSVAELPDIGLLWPDVETYMRTQWIAPAAAAAAATKATSAEDDDNTASTTDKQ